MKRLRRDRVFEAHSTAPSALPRCAPKFRMFWAKITTFLDFYDQRERTHSAFMHAIGLARTHQPLDRACAPCQTRPPHTPPHTRHDRHKMGRTIRPVRDEPISLTLTNPDGSTNEQSTAPWSVSLSRCRRRAPSGMPSETLASTGNPKSRCSAPRSSDLVLPLTPSACNNQPRNRRCWNGAAGGGSETTSATQRRGG